MIRLQTLGSLAVGECFPLHGKWQGKTLLQQIGGRVRENNKYALPVCEDSDVNIPGGGSRGPTNTSGNGGILGFFHNSGSLPPRGAHSVLCVGEFLVLFLGFLEFGFCWKEAH